MIVFYCCIIEINFNLDFVYNYLGEILIKVGELEEGIYMF